MYLCYDANVRKNSTQNSIYYKKYGTVEQNELADDYVYIYIFMFLSHLMKNVKWLYMKTNMAMFKNKIT